MSIRRRIFRTAGRAVGWALLSVVLALGAALIVVPAFVGATPLTVLTSSMEPTLPPGTVVVVKPVPVEDIAVGDVLTYQIEPDRPAVVSHRVIQVLSVSDGSVQFITKGDANGAPDVAPVLAEQVRGVVWYNVPLVGWITNGVMGQYRNVLIPTAAAALLLFAFGTVLSTLLDARRTRRRTASAFPDPVTEARGEGSSAADPSAMPPAAPAGRSTAAQPTKAQSTDARPTLTAPTR